VHCAPCAALQRAEASPTSAHARRTRKEWIRATSSSDGASPRGAPGAGAPGAGLARLEVDADGRAEDGGGGHERGERGAAATAVHPEDGEGEVRGARQGGEAVASRAALATVEALRVPPSGPPRPGHPGRAMDEAQPRQRKTRFPAETLADVSGSPTPSQVSALQRVFDPTWPDLPQRETGVDVSPSVAAPIAQMHAQRQRELLVPRAEPALRAPGGGEMVSRGLGGSSAGRSEFQALVSRGASGRGGAQTEATVGELERSHGDASGAGGGRLGSERSTSISERRMRGPLPTPTKVGNDSRLSVCQGCLGSQPRLLDRWGQPCSRGMWRATRAGRVPLLLHAPCLCAACGAGD
jgi:hypothetical protein